MSTDVAKTPLADLAIEINVEHDAAAGKAAEAVEHAHRCGELLLEAKSQMKHGEWLPWLKENCKVRREQARKYMRLAEGWSKLPPGGNFKTIRQALELLDSPNAREAKVKHNSGNVEWYTPWEYVEAARKAMQGIDLDPASTEVANHTVRATTYYTKEQDGLRQDWWGRVFLNPPFTSGLVEQFVIKLIRHLTYTEDGDDFNEVNKRFGSSSIRKVNEAILLTNNSTEAKWFDNASGSASAICLPTSRIRFIDPTGTRIDSPLQGQAFHYFGKRPARFLMYFQRLGRVWIQHIDPIRSVTSISGIDDLFGSLTDKYGPQEVSREEFREHAVANHPNFGGDVNKFKELVKPK